MTENVSLAWRVMAGSSADALEAAKQRARDDGYVIKGVSTVKFAGPGTWDVVLTVAKREPMGDEPAR